MKNRSAVSPEVPAIPSTHLSRDKLINLDYEGFQVSLNEDGWINATEAAERFGKRIDNYLANADTKAYIEALCEENNHWNVRDYNKSGVKNNTRDSGYYIKTRRGRNGSTWFHSELAVHFARWLDVRFAIWCDRQIRKLISGTHPHYDWKRIRHEASSSYKVMGAVLQLVRQNQGKPTQHFHYANEAKLVNWAMTGEYKPLSRDILSVAELDLLAKLEERNAVLVGCGLGREERKMALTQFVSDFKIPTMIKGGVA